MLRTILRTLPLLLIAVTIPCELSAQRPAPSPSPSPWDNAIVYFAITDRFSNGDPSNDHAYGRGFDGTGEPYAADPVGHFYGGDFAGLTDKIESGYFSELGVNALWISAPYEQIHGWVGGGDGSHQAYGYHGYWALDYTEIDSTFGTPESFQTLVDTAHDNGIRIVVDVVLNHPGYAALHDMAAFGFGHVTSDAWRTWRPTGEQSWHSYHDLYIDYVSGPDQWANWWGPDWIRSGLPGHDACGAREVTLCLDALPDFRTENGQPVDLPAFLQKKWGSDKTARHREEMVAFARRSGYTASPRIWIIKWLSDLVRTYGIDGFRIDTAKHVEMKTWRDLKEAAVHALASWKRAHPDKKIDDAPFWMTGEVFGHGLDRSAYFDFGFDSLINFSLQREAAHVIDFDSLFSHYATTLAAANQPFNVLSYLSSHDTRLFDRSSLEGAATVLMLLPGAVQIFYGDETGRPGFAAPVDSIQATRSPMRWNEIDNALLDHWRKLGSFRSRHPAIAAGTHVPLSEDPYIFERRLQVGRFKDAVIVAVGAEGRCRINVSHLYPDNTILRDAYSGKIAFVSYGMATFTVDPSGVLLIEEVE